MALDGARALVFETFGTAKSRTPAAAEPGLGAERRRSDLTGRGARLLAEHAERAQGSVAKRSGTAQRERRDLMAKYRKDRQPVASVVCPRTLEFRTPRLAAKPQRSHRPRPRQRKESRGSQGARG